MVFVYTVMNGLDVMHKDGFSRAVYFPSIVRPLIANVYTLFVMNLCNK